MLVIAALLWAVFALMLCTSMVYALIAAASRAGIKVDRSTATTRATAAGAATPAAIPAARFRGNGDSGGGGSSGTAVLDRRMSGNRGEWRDEGMMNCLHAFERCHIAEGGRHRWARTPGMAAACWSGWCRALLLCRQHAGG